MTHVGAIRLPDSGEEISGTHETDLADFEALKRNVLVA